MNAHQLLIAVLGTAQRGSGRRGVVTELVAAARRSGAYAGSIEELSPAHRDPMALIPLVAASVATLIQPAGSSWFASGSVANYALTPEGWDQILDAVDHQ